MRILVATDRFPELSETFITAEISALAALGHDVRVEASWRASRPNPDIAIKATFLAEDGRRAKFSDLLWLLSRHLYRCCLDLRSRRRWRREESVRPLRELAPAARRLARGGERHVHVHFAAEAALDWMRIAALLGLPYSVTAHAYEIFMSPANLREKLERAAFATTGCEYNVRHLRSVAPAAEVHEIVMGVDGDRFRRTAPYPDGARPHVLAVGRLVEKKGFRDLVAAAAVLPGVRVSIVGAGPLEDELRALAGASVEFLGARSPDEIRTLLETADLLAMPCVVARDGDRDSMPVVVKEALAMEVPVVATDEVGLPELVRPEWGRLVPPGDADALAAAIAELLALPHERRAAMGRAGRAHVLEAASVRLETEKLVALIARG